MTEWSMLSTPLQDPHNTKWDISLFLAKLMYADLAIANVVDWCFWTAMARE